MKLLVDANLSPRVATVLAGAGISASHVADHGLVTASDREIAAFAVANAMAIVSAGSDFASMLALSGHTAPSLVLLRSADAMTPEEQGEFSCSTCRPSRPTLSRALW